jgi:predicted LPLAT superfamily acyltransferase
MDAAARARQPLLAAHHVHAVLLAGAACSRLVLYGIAAYFVLFGGKACRPRGAIWPAAWGGQRAGAMCTAMC